MTATDFYNKRIKEDPNIGTIQLMEEYAKHIIEINFCDGSKKIPIKDIEKIQRNINMCVDWVNE